MNIKNKITALLCAAAAAISLTACSENTSAVQGGTGSSPISAPSSISSITESTSDQTSSADSSVESVPESSAVSSEESSSVSGTESSAPPPSSTQSSSQSSSASSSSTKTSSSSSSKISSVKEKDPVNENIMYITANGTTFTAKLADNSSAKALVELLKKGDITINAHDYGSFEKVGSLPQSLPRNDEQITTSAGDLILYQGDQFVFYYDTNSWNFTRLGKVEGVTTAQLRTIFGAGNIDLKLSLKKGSAASSSNTTAPPFPR